jgi:hypothetical protein
VSPRQRLLDLSEAAYGWDHREVAGTLNNLGMAWRDLGEPAKARELYVRALRILLAHVPSRHSDVSIVTRNLRSVAPDLGCRPEPRGRASPRSGGRCAGRPSRSTLLGECLSARPKAGGES